MSETTTAPAKTPTILKHTMKSVAAAYGISSERFKGLFSDETWAEIMAMKGKPNQKTWTPKMIIEAHKHLGKPAEWKD